jgi:hypothetical protein
MGEGRKRYGNKTLATFALQFKTPDPQLGD